MKKSNIKIRKAIASDAISIARIQIDGWLTSYSKIISESYLKSLNQGRKTKYWENVIKNSSTINILIYEINKMPVGFVAFGKSNFDPNYGEIYALYVSLDFQNKGYGSKLFNSAKINLQRHFQSIIVWVLKENLYKRFYTKHLGVLQYSRIIKIGSEMVKELGYKWAINEN